MKSFLPSLILAASLLSGVAQDTPAPTPAEDSEAQRLLEEFIAQRRQVPAVGGAQNQTRPAPGLPGLPAPGQTVPAAPGGATAPGNPAAGPTVAPGTTAATPAAQSNSNDDIIATNLLRFEAGATLDNLLDVYSMLVNRVILKPTTLPPLQDISIKVTDVELTRKEAIQALDTYLSLNQITTMPMGDKFLLVVPNASAPLEGSAWNQSKASELPDASQFISHIVQLKHVKPSELIQVLQFFAKSPNSLIAVDGSQTLVIRDYAVNVKRMLELIEQVDVAVPVEYLTELIPIKYALAADIAQVLGGLTTSGSVTAVGSSSQSGLGGFNNQPVSFPGQSRSSGNFGTSGRGGYGGNFNTYSDTYAPLQNRSPVPAGGATAGGRSAFQNRLNQLVSSVGGGGSGGDVQVLGETKIIADERTNSLLVFANLEDMATIKDIVAKMDVVLAQVLIEAILMEVNIGDRQTISVSAASKNQSGDNKFGSLMNNGLGFANFAGATNISDFGNNAPTGFSWFGEFGENFAVAINMAAQDNRVKVLSRPSVQTSHAVPANLFVGETRPYITGTYYNSYGGGGSQSQYQQTQIGLQLSVLPLINPEGLVVMDIQQQVQQVGGNVVIDGNEVPITQDQSASAKVAVKDRDTVILGGFIRNSLSKNENGVPVLKDIPILGHLFRSKNKDNSRRELIVLIRPTVLPTPDDAAKLVGKQKDRAPELKEAEVDFDMEEARRLKKANEEIMKKRLGLDED